VINIQARTITDNLASLVKQLDEMVQSVEDKKGSDTNHAFLVYLTNDPDAAQEELESFAEKHQIKKIPLTLFDGEAGPPNYEIAEEADVTVMMWKDKKIRANCAFTSDSFDKRAVNVVLEKAREHVKTADEETP